MFVRDCMSTPVVTVTPNTPFQTALQLMHERNFRRLPVVGKNGQLAGIVSERDLLHASPSPATSLSIWEMNYLLDKLTVQQVMTRSIIITTANTPIEHAASLMVANKVGGLPVVDEQNRVVGIITETDIFKVFVDMIDGDGGIRLTLDLAPGESLPFSLIETIYAQGGHLASLGTVHCDGRQRTVIVVKGVPYALLAEPLRLLGDRLTDIYNISHEAPVPAAMPAMPRNGTLRAMAAR